jgi:hypothetical protein
MTSHAFLLILFLIFIPLVKVTTNHISLDERWSGWQRAHDCNLRQIGEEFLYFRYYLGKTDDKGSKYLHHIQIRNSTKRTLEIQYRVLPQEGRSSFCDLSTNDGLATLEPNEIIETENWTGFRHITEVLVLPNKKK